MHILDTERLRLRWFEPRDAAFVCGLLNEPSWLQHIGDRGVRTEAQAAAWIDDRLVASYRRQGFGFWAVERRTDGELVGMCGLTHRDGLAAPDVGFAFRPAHWGHGYAREAAAACLRHGHERLGMPLVLAITGPDNAASARVLTAIGMRPLGGLVRVTEHHSRLFVWRAPPEAA